MSDIDESFDTLSVAASYLEMDEREGYRDGNGSITDRVMRASRALREALTAATARAEKAEAERAELARALKESNQIFARVDGERTALVDACAQRAAERDTEHAARMRAETEARRSDEISAAWFQAWKWAVLDKTPRTTEQLLDAILAKRDELLEETNAPPKI